MLKSFKRNLLCRPKLARRCGQLRRGDQREPLQLEVGSQNHSFELVSKDHFGDFDFTLYKFRHTRLGTTHYHVDSSDTNNCFAINFTTLPEDSTGKMHILEHLALCGSEKYPVRDPFMNMIRRSLNTYMNAWTGPDFTCYPFSTVNKADYYNLMSVYGESVFKPLLKKTDFMQEGWRLEFEEPENPASDLKIKGVVYNEMKGVYENPDNLFMEHVQELLMQGTPYRHDSGGKPLHIPDLTHEALRDYHRKFYHPSNATLFTYGDLSPLAHQAFLEQHFLKDFAKLAFAKPQLRPQLSAPRRELISMPPSAVELKPDQGTWFGVTFLCNDINTNIKDLVGLELLSNLLFDSPTSPFYEDFLEAGLADGYSPACGYEHNVFPSYFTIGFKNIKNGSEQLIEQKIFETLEHIAKDGLDPDMVSSTIHQIEISSKVAKSNFGLQLLMQYLGPLNHQVDDIIKQGLNISQVLAEIRENTAQGNSYLQDLIRKYFLDNQQRLYLTMKPDPDYLAKVGQAEAEKIDSFRRALTEEKKADIVREALQLKREQEAPQNNDVLPTLTVEDIPADSEPTQVFKEQIEGIDTFFYLKPTNGVTHFRIKVDLASVGHSSINQLHLLSSMLDKVGTEHHSYEDFYNLVRQDTTGIEMSLFYDNHPLDKNKINGFAVISVSCLDRNVEKMFGHLGDLLTSADFKDHENIRNLIRIDSSAAANSIVERPLEFAIDYGISSQSRAQHYFNKLAIVPSAHQNRFVCNYGSSIQRGEVARMILEDLETETTFILHKMFRRNQLQFAVHASAPAREAVKRHAASFVQKLKSKYRRTPRSPRVRLARATRPRLLRLLARLLQRLLRPPLANQLRHRNLLRTRLPRSRLRKARAAHRAAVEGPAAQTHPRTRRRVRLRREVQPLLRRLHLLLLPRPPHPRNPRQLRESCRLGRVG